LIDLKKQVDDLASAGKGVGSGGKHSPDEGGDDINADFDKLRAEMNRLREETQNSLKAMSEQLNGKASKDDLGELEAKIINMINEMLKRLLT
jgi:hypothetical protein